MAREIKFRAWDKNKRDWVDMLALMLPTESETESFVLMQYTGLKDKNGKEIYEGDVIRIFVRRHVEPSVHANAEVVFAGGVFWFEARQIGFTDCNWHLYNQSDREVVGNIYETPDLLK